MSLFKNKIILLTSAAALSLPSAGQQAVNVGKGSYAAYTPLSMSKTDEHGGDQSRSMQYRKLYVTEREGQPIPTNDWWTNLITERYSGHLWAYPQFIQAQSYGIDVQWPSYWIDNGTEMKSRTILKVGGIGFSPESATAESWHDWDVEFSMKDGNKSFFVTMVHGMPFTWVETKNVVPQLTIGSNATVYSSDGTPITSGTKTDRISVVIGNDCYGVYLPENTSVNISEGTVTLRFNGRQNFLSIAVLHSSDDLDKLAEYACNVPRDTRVTWSYDAAAGKLRTQWDITAENLKGGSADRVMQGFMPHQYRDTGNSCTLPFNDLTYSTPHGTMKMADGNSFEVTYDFFGMLPCYALPADEGEHGFDKTRMLQMLGDYASTGTFGDDTYWGGKGLTQMALYMMFAREMGETELFKQCRNRLKETMIDWLTYTPGETRKFFARYDRWGALVGYNTSYDSETFNDHHFHYGYFTLAGAMLALVDKDFRDNYGPMLKEVAKDYANWDRADNRYPLFRTFDPWAGHSFAGGMGDGNGNGQESSSEAMQSWGGLYLLGVALGDNDMRDAGIFGWVSEARGTQEYWFDRRRDNIDYTKFISERTGQPFPYNSNFTCHGVGWWTYFGYDNVYMQGIQWMPISPALDYLAQPLPEADANPIYGGKPFVQWDYDHLKDITDHAFWGETAAEGQPTLEDSDWGNVVLSYYQYTNPSEVAAIFDNLWDTGKGTARNSSTNGITYFITHSHLTYGDLDWTVHGSIPSSRVFDKNGVKTYMAFNPSDSPTDVTFSDGTRLEGVPARQLKVSSTESVSVSDISDTGQTEDARSELVMKNIALGKPCTASGYENAGCLPEYATDGDTGSRWGSRHKDGEWIQVDLGEEASLYKVRIHWEAAFASEYKIMTSTDAIHWEEMSVSGDGGIDETLMGDVKARYVKILGVKRNSQYGISLYEIEVYGRLASMTDDDILGLKITTDADFIKQYEPSKVNIKGYTCGGEWKDVEAQWSTDDGTITAEGMFTPSVYGSATVKATVGDLTVLKDIVVEESLKTSKIKLSPENSVIIEGGRQTFTVEASDQFGCPADAADVEYDVMKVTEEEGKTVLTPTADATFGASDTSLSADIPGEYALVATASGVSDTAYVSVRKFTDVNLAYKKPAVSSSDEDSNGMGADKAFDGDTSGTRWGSAWNGLTSEEADDQRLTVDLQGLYSINRVVMFWQAARASEYKLQVSSDGALWTDVQTVTNSPEGREEISFDAVDARFVRMQGVKRNMGYGYSLYEMEVYGTRKVGDAAGLVLDGIGKSGAGLLSGYWNADEFSAIDKENMLSAYDLSGVTASSGTSFVTANPNAFIIVSEQQDADCTVTNTSNVAVADGEGYSSRSISLTDGSDLFIDNTLEGLKAKANSAEYTRTFDAPVVTTIAVPFSADLPAGATAYEPAEFDGGVLTLKEVSRIEAGKPYLLKTDAPMEMRLTAENAEIDARNDGRTAASGVSLHASWTEKGIGNAADAYSLNDDYHTPVFIKQDVTVGAFRAWLTAQTDANEITVKINGTTGIRPATDEELGGVFNVYSIDGKLITRSKGRDSLIKLPKGVYIINGRKIAIR